MKSVNVFYMMLTVKQKMRILYLLVNLLHSGWYVLEVVGGHKLSVEYREEDASRHTAQQVLEQCPHLINSALSQLQAHTCREKCNQGVG